MCVDQTVVQRMACTQLLDQTHVTGSGISHKLFLYQCSSSTCLPCFASANHTNNTGR